MGSLSRRPRLLFLCQTLPYPPDGGVWIRTYHVLRLLARTFDVTALCFERAGSAGECDREASREALARLAEVEVFAIPQRHSRLRFAWDHARSLARGRVYTSYLYESSAFRRRLEERLRSQHFDLVHADSPSHPIDVVTTGFPIAQELRIFRRVPPPTRNGTM